METTTVKSPLRIHRGQKRGSKYDIMVASVGPCVVGSGVIRIMGCLGGPEARPIRGTPTTWVAFAVLYQHPITPELHEMRPLPLVNQP